MEPITEQILDVADDCQIVSSRVLNATIEMVFRAWTDPRHLEKWWGPAGFTNTFQEFDLRPGGKWRFIMHGPEKGNYVNECVFLVIEKPVLLAWYRISRPIFQVVASFEEISSEQTKLVFKMLFEDANECRKVKTFAVGKNEENFDRLEEELRTMAK